MYLKIFTSKLIRIKFRSNKPKENIKNITHKMFQVKRLTLEMLNSTDRTLRDTLNCNNNCVDLTVTYHPREKKIIFAILNYYDLL